MALIDIKRQRDSRSGKRTPGPDQKVTLSHRAIYFLLISVGFLTRWVPYSFARTMGRALGRLYYRIDGSRRHTALLNLDQVFAERKSEAEKQRIVRACCEHFGVAIVEILCLSRIDGSNFRDYVDLEGIEGFQEGLAQGKGMILCSAHYGNWEIMNLVLGHLNLPLSAMARPMDNPLVHDFIEAIRTRSGNRVIYKHKAVRKVLANLAENRIVGIVNDQDVHDGNRMMAPFFGTPAATTPVPAALSHKTGAPLISGYAVPYGDGRYLLKFGPLIQPNGEAEKEGEIERLTLELNRRLETQIEALPDCWMWIHQRFKTGAEGPSGFYKRTRSPQ